MTAKTSDPSESRRTRFETEAVPFMAIVYRVARRLAHTEDNARDLVQDTYLRAYRAFDTFKAGTNCRAWLLTILYSVFNNQYRRSKREPELLPIDEDRLPDAGFSATLGHVAIDRETIEAALAALPELFRAIVVLVDVEDLSYEEAAAVLACPVGTVRSRLSRARKQLHALLHEQARKAGYLTK